MAHSIQFTPDFVWVPPGAIRSFDANLNLLKWFFTHSTVQGGWVKLDFLAKSDAELRQLVETVPDFGTAARNLTSFRNLLFHLSSEHRFSEDQVTQIGTLITDWNAQGVETLKRYCPDEPATASNYRLLVVWAGKAEQMIAYVQRKIAHSCAIVDTFGKFREDFDKLNPLMNKLVVGCVTKMECQVAGKKSLESQEKCLKHIKAYFATVPHYEDDDSLHLYLQTLIPGMTVGDRTIQQMKAARGARTLHKKNPS